MSQFANDAGPSDLAILAYQVRECTLKLFDATDSDALILDAAGNSQITSCGMRAMPYGWQTCSRSNPSPATANCQTGWAEKFGQHSQPTIGQGLAGTEQKFVRDLETQLKRSLGSAPRIPRDDCCQGRSNTA